MADPAPKRGRPAGYRKPEEERVVPITVGLDPPYVLRLDALCEQRGTTRRHVLQAAIRALEELD